MEGKYIVKEKAMGDEMKKQVLFILCAVVLLIGQAKPPVFTLSRDSAAKEWCHAQCEVKVQSLDALRASINSVLAVMGWKVLSSDTGRPPLADLSMSVVRYPSADPNKRQVRSFNVYMDGTNAKITADWGPIAGPSLSKDEAKQFYDEFFTKLAAALK
jgi:hypothetical protein